MGVRPWEVKKVRTTCPFCGTGCNFDLNVNTRTGKVIGVTPTDSDKRYRAFVLKVDFTLI